MVFGDDGSALHYERWGGCGSVFRLTCYLFYMLYVLPSYRDGVGVAGCTCAYLILDYI